LGLLLTIAKGVMQMSWYGRKTRKAIARRGFRGVTAIVLLIVVLVYFVNTLMNILVTRIEGELSALLGSCKYTMTPVLAPLAQNFKEALYFMLDPLHAYTAAFVIALVFNVYLRLRYGRRKTRTWPYKYRRYYYYSKGLWEH